MRPGNVPLHPLDGPREKIKWAGKRLDDLDTFLGLWRFLKPPPYGFVRKLDANREFYVYRLNALHPPPIAC